MTAVPFAVTVEHEQGRSLIHAGGELDMATAPALERALADCEGNGEQCVLDLEGVTFIDSTGLRVLIVAAEQAAATARTLAILPSAAVARLVELTGLEQILSLDGSPPATQEGRVQA